MFAITKFYYQFELLINKMSYLERYFILFLTNTFHFFLNGFLLKNNKIYIFIESLNLHFFLSYCKSNSIIRFTSLMDITAIDYPNRVSRRFELVYSFWSKSTNFRFFIKTFLTNIHPVLSIGNFFSSSLWLEREIWDLFGIKFLLHNDLRRILTDYGFQGHPLRKNFPLVGFVELRYDDLFQSILIEPLRSHSVLDFLGLRILGFLGNSVYVDIFHKS